MSKYHFDLSSAHSKNIFITATQFLFLNKHNKLTNENTDTTLQSTWIVFKAIYIMTML